MALRAGIPDSARGKAIGQCCGCISEQPSCSVNVRAKADRKGRLNRCRGGTTMTIHQYAWKAVQDDAQRAGERNRLLLEARRARVARRKPVVSAAPPRRLARLLLRRAPA